MAFSSSRPNISYHVQSEIFPRISHPTTLRVEEELNKIQSWEATATRTAETIFNNLSLLEDLHKSIDELLNLAHTQLALSHHREKRVKELLDGFVKVLDIRGSIKDLVSQIKEHVRDLQSAVRRRKGDLSMESSIAKYNSFQKKIKKDAKRLIASLKQMESRSSASDLLDVDHNVSAVIRVLREVSTVDISIFQSILLFISMPVSKPKRTKSSPVLKLINKGEVVCENQLKNLKRLEGSVEGVENGLECIFKRLVGTKASLLNTISY